MCSLKLKIDWRRIYRAIIAVILLMMAGVLIQSLWACLQREGIDRLDWLIFLSFSLLVVLIALVLALIGLVKNHTLDEVLEDLGRWWQKEETKVVRDLTRRLLYLLGAAACAAVDYLMVMVSKNPMEGDWWVTGRLLLGRFCIVVTIVPATLIGLGMLLLAIFDPPLAELVIWGWPRPRKKEG